LHVALIVVVRVYILDPFATVRTMAKLTIAPATAVKV